MIAFEVHFNGERLCVAAIDGPGSINIMADILRRPARDPSSSEMVDGEGPTELRFIVGGLKVEGDGGSTMLTWANRRLVSGDTLQIRVVEADAWDQAKLREPSAPQSDKESRRRWYEQLKKEFGE